MRVSIKPHFWAGKKVGWHYLILIICTLVSGARSRSLQRCPRPSGNYPRTCPPTSRHNTSCLQSLHIGAEVHSPYLKGHQQVSCCSLMVGPIMKMQHDGGVLKWNCCVKVRKNQGNHWEQSTILLFIICKCNSYGYNLQLSYNEEALIFYYFMPSAEQQTARTRAALPHLHPDTVQYIQTLWVGEQKLTLLQTFVH